MNKEQEKKVLEIFADCGAEINPGYRYSCMCQIGQLLNAVDRILNASDRLNTSEAVEARGYMLSKKDSKNPREKFKEKIEKITVWGTDSKTGGFSIKQLRPSDIEDYANGKREKSKPCGVIMINSLKDNIEKAVNGRKMLELAGKMSDAARVLVGGPNITAGHSEPANVFTVCDAAEKLREAVDAYDQAVLDYSK